MNDGASDKSEGKRRCKAELHQRIHNDHLAQQQGHQMNRWVHRSIHRSSDVSMISTVKWHGGALDVMKGKMDREIIQWYSFCHLLANDSIDPLNYLYPSTRSFSQVQRVISARLSFEKGECKVCQHCYRFQTEPQVYNVLLEPWILVAIWQVFDSPAWCRA